MSCFKLFKSALINVANRKDHVKLKGKVKLDEVYQEAKGRNNSLLVRSMRPPRRRGRGTYNEDMVPIFAWLRGEDIHSCEGC